MNKQKNIDIAHEERFDYGLISINYGVFFYILLSAIQVNMIFFFTQKLIFAFTHTYFQTNINNYVGRFHSDLYLTFKILISLF